MYEFKRMPVLLLSIIVCALLVSCTTEGETDSYIGGEYTYDYYANDAAPDTTESNGYIITPEVTHAPFTGIPGQRHNFIWHGGREGAWEVDIVRFAESVLGNHPFFVGMDFLHANNRVAGRASEDYYYYVFNMLLQRAAVRNGIFTDDADEIKQALRELFIDRINLLIKDIPNRNDFEIKYGLGEITVLLDDMHTHIFGDFPPQGQVFPVQILSLYHGVYFIGVPKEIEHTLYGELIAINNIDINEVIERLATVISHESEYFLRQAALPLFLMTKELLEYIDVVGDYGMVDFTVRGTTGEIFYARLWATDRDSFNNMCDTEFVRHESDILANIMWLMYAGEDRENIEFFWYDYLAQDNMLYVRISSFTESAATRETIRALTERLRDWPRDEKIEKLIIDLRQNQGGTIDWPSIPDIPLLSEIVGAVYVLIDGASASRSVLVASNLRYYMENVIIVGESSGQQENFFSGITLSMPNSGFRYRVSGAMHVQSRSYDVALRPDIFTPLTINDVINNRDPVLEYVWAR